LSLASVPDGGGWRPSFWALAAIATGLFGLSFFAHAGVLDAGFLGWDDPWYVSENLRIRSFDAANLRWMFTNTEMHNWHPLVWVSHAIDYALYGLDPRGHHLGNVVLHGLNTVWVFVLAIALLQGVGGREPWSMRPSQLPGEKVAAAAIAALLFGVHPQHVESVAWVSERKDVLCLFFLFPSILAYLVYVKEAKEAKDAKDAGGRWRRVFYGLSLLFYLLAVMSKAMAVTLPVLLLILDLYPLERLPQGARRWPDAAERREWARLLLEKVPYAAITVVASAVAVLAQGFAEGKGVAGFENVPKGFRVLNAFNSVLFYVEKMLWPANLSTYYAPLESYHSFWQSLPLYWLPLGLVPIVSLCCLFAWWRGRPLWLAVWLFYLVTLSPVIGIIQVGGQAAADRYAYLPTIPFYLLIGVALARPLFRPGPLGSAARWGAVLLVVMVSGVLVGLTRQQARHWQDDVAFWERASMASPRNALVNQALGGVYLAAGDHAGAIRALRVLVEVDSRNPQSRLYLAEAYREAGRMDAALDAVDPVARELLERDEHGIYLRIAREACNRGRRLEATRAIDKARELDPDDPDLRRLSDEIRTRSCR